MNDNLIFRKKIYLRPFLILSEDLKFKENHSTLRNYLFYLLNDMDKCISKINKNNFWDIFPKILGLDSKLQLLNFYVKIEDDIDLSDKEIIQCIEEDYYMQNKELLQHGLDPTNSTSIIFFVK